MVEENTGIAENSIKDAEGKIPDPVEEGVKEAEKTTSELDRADEIAERQKRENDRREKLIEREESLAARKAVGGDLDAGNKPVKKTDDEKWAEGAKERYEGTGLDPTPDDGSPTVYA